MQRLTNRNPKISKDASRDLKGSRKRTLMNDKVVAMSQRRNLHAQTTTGRESYRQGGTGTCSVTDREFNLRHMQTEIAKYREVGEN